MGIAYFELMYKILARAGGYDAYTTRAQEIKNEDEETAISYVNI